VRALITGATGFVGRHLSRRFKDLSVLTRRPDAAAALLRHATAFQWAPESEPAPVAALRGTDAVFHLAGEPVSASRWTPDVKRRIRESRVTATRNLVAGLAALPERPAVLVCASAVGYYGNRGDEPLDEKSSAGTGFLAGVCEEWEREALAAAALGMRVACVRLGIVLAARGGALGRMLPMFRLGLGGRLGRGLQWMPWIHVEDVVELMIHVAESDRVAGPVNAVAPQAVTNSEFTAALAHAVSRPALLPVPEIALRLTLGEVSEVLLASQRVFPGVALASGYRFRHPKLVPALEAIAQADAATP
jgi:uncharacterized protein (TIGR01777 family)